MTKKEREDKKKLFLEAMRESRGMICSALRAAGISKQTLYNWKASDEAFASEIDAIKEETKEWVQGKLLTLIENGSTAATLFFLKTQCQWVERRVDQVELSTPETINVKAAIEEIRQTLAKPEDKNETKSDE